MLYVQINSMLAQSKELDHFTKFVQCMLGCDFLASLYTFLFLQLCQDGGDGPCDNVDYVEPYRLIKIKPCNIDDILVDVEHVDVIADGDKEALAVCC